MAMALWGGGLFWAGSAATGPDAILGWQIAHLGGFFTAAFFYHMVCIFCRIERKKLLYFVYAQAIIFNIIGFRTNYLFDKTRLAFGLYYNSATPLLAAGIVIYLSVIILSYYELSKFLQKTKGLKRRETLYVIFGFMAAFLGVAAVFLSEFHMDLLSPFGAFGIILYCLIISYAIFRYHIMDMQLAFRKSMVYLFSDGIMTSLFIIFIFFITRYLSDFTEINLLTIAAVAALTVAVFFYPLKVQVQVLIDRMFHKKSYDYYLTIQKMSRRIASISDIDKLFDYVGDTVFSMTGVSRIYLLSSGPDRGYEVVYRKVYQKKTNNKTGVSTGNDGEGIKIKKSSELIRFFKKSEEILFMDELPAFEGALGPEKVEHIMNDLKPFKCSTVVPVFVDDKLSLLIVLGEKLSGDMFTDEEINLLYIVSSHITVALKNAELYKDKIHNERLASMGMMSATFAHEIRNPLTSLKTFAQLMPEKYNDPEFRDTFSRIVIGEIERIDGLIEDLLDFSSAKDTSRINYFNLITLIDDIVDYVRSRIEFENRDILFERHYEKDEINMTGYAEKLKQAFINIITNGCQSMHGQGVMKINIKIHGRYVDVTISDTGEGISEKDIVKIFDPFITTKEMGIGLGLAISKRIIENHNGKIQVKSKVSKGTTFTVTLPVQND